MKDFDSWFNQSTREHVVPVKKERVLTDEAEDDRADFETEREGMGCSCHLCAPCGWCVHPGNPRNQDEDDNCWRYV